MGITASAPLRWSSPIKRSGATGSPDLSNSQDTSDHSKINSTVRDAVSSDTSNVNQHPESLETPAPTSRSVLADPKRCLVTQEAGPSVVPCYLFNPRLWRYNGMLTRLEWHWGMKYSSLELNVEANRIYLCQDLLESFDSNRWLLLPPPEMVDRVWARYFMNDLKNPIQQSPIESIYEGAEVFEYRLLPLDKDLHPIKRFDEPDSIRQSSPLNADPAEQNSTRHSYPFDNLPILVSSVEPHFVILDSAAKLFDQPWRVSTVVHSLWPISEYDASHMLWHLEYVYRVWLEIEAPSGFASTSRTPLWASALDAGARLPTVRPMSPTVCTGPCFRSRFAWQPSVCSRCQHTGDDDMSDDSAASDSDDGFRSLSLSGNKAYRKSLDRYIVTWRARCLKMAGKYGRWTSRVLNDKQLRGYPASVCG